MNRIFRLIPLMLLPGLTAITANAQTKAPRKGEFYFSWGYNTEWYTKSNVKVNQPEIGNDYQFHQITGHDHKGWDEGLTHIALTIPQYNYRIGYFFDRIRGMGFELNFDHTKFIFKDGQQAHIQGKLGGRQVDTSVNFSQANGFYYYLNNGANFFLFNFVKRWKLYGTKDGNFRLDFLGQCLRKSHRSPSGESDRGRRRAPSSRRWHH